MEVTNNDTLKLEVFNPIWDDITIEAAGADTFETNQVLAFDASTGTYKKTVSGTAAVANAKAILKEEVVFTGAGTKKTRALLGGEINSGVLVFEGADTLETIPAGADDSFRVQLRAYGIVARDGVRIDNLDNQ